MKLLSLIGFKIQSGPRVFLIAPKHLALIYIRKTTYFVFYWQNDTMLQRKIWQHIRNILTKSIYLFVGEMIVLFYLQQRAQKANLSIFKTVKTRLRNFIFYFFIYRDWTNSYLKQYEHMLRTSITRSFCIIGNEKIVFNEDLRLEMCFTRYFCRNA